MIHLDNEYYRHIESCNKSLRDSQTKVTEWETHNQCMDAFPFRNRMLLVILIREDIK